MGNPFAEQDIEQAWEVAHDQREADVLPADEDQ